MPERLDHILVARRLARTRSRARDLILRGAVSVDGAIATKAGAPVGENARIAVLASAGGGRVSRGALKLEAALDAFGFSPERRVALDVGASTGGFTEVLLERGAAMVHAVDVGHDQIHERLRSDPRVVVLEGLDARALGPRHLSTSAGAITIDVSFISVLKLLPAVLALAGPNAWLVALVKPQFEVGRAHVGRGGIVRDEAQRASAVDRVVSWIAAQAGWRVTGVIPSPIAGGSGNREFLLGALHAGR